MSQEAWPLEGICLKTIIKITACNVFLNGGEIPHYQISIDGFILSSFGDVMLANVQISVEEKNAANVDGIVEACMPDSIHWLESSDFGISKGEYHFYRPTMTAIDADLKAATDEFFPAPVARDREARQGEFWYAGVVYVPGRGEMAYGSIPWVR